MSQNLIETVAQAMHGNRYEWPRPEFAEHREDYRKMAESAILAFLKAIREPTQAMMDAGHNAWQSQRQNVVFQAMIDALRAEIESAP
jgi:hypothetical protein